MSNTYEEKKELQEEVLDQAYYVEPSRGTLVWDEESGIAEAGEESTEEPKLDAPATEATPDQLDLSMLDAPVAPEEETKPDEAYTKFEADFEKYMGTPLKEAVTLVNELRNFQAAQVVERQKVELRDAWGVSGAEFDSRLQAVQERWKLLPPETQKAHDNAQGAQLIWLKLQQERGQGKSVPSLDKGSSKNSVATPKYKYTQAQINKMSNAEYSRLAGDIASAFANGLVKR